MSTEKKDKTNEVSKKEDDEIMYAKLSPEPRGGRDDLKRIVAMIERAVETNQVNALTSVIGHLFFD